MLPLQILWAYLCMQLSYDSRILGLIWVDDDLETLVHLWRHNQSLFDGVNLQCVHKRDLIPGVCFAITIVAVLPFCMIKSDHRLMKTSYYLEFVFFLETMDRLCLLCM